MKKTIMFGSGNLAERILESSDKLRISLIIDNDRSKWDKTILICRRNYTVSSPDILKTLRLEDYEVVIGSTYTDEMLDQVMKLTNGITKHQLVRFTDIEVEDGFFRLYLVAFGSSCSVHHEFQPNARNLVFLMGDEPCSIKVEELLVDGKPCEDESVLETNGDRTESGGIDFASCNPTVYIENVEGLKTVDLSFSFVETNYKKAYEFACNYIKTLSDFSNNINPYFVPEEDYVPVIFNEGDVKPIAYYLPQFHQVPQNDEWWEKGFTEWTNVTKAYPLFEGHYQPHLPIDMGFYDLSNIEVQKRQIELAKKYGVYGFCYYYYHFAEKKLLDAPLARVSTNSQLDFPFCIMWDTENWTRRWAGDNSTILEIAQTDEFFRSVIEDLFKYINDTRYITINERPLVLIYNITKIKHPERLANIWKEYCKECGIPEPYLVFTNRNTDIKQSCGFDAVCDFADGSGMLNKTYKQKLYLKNPLNIFKYSEYFETEVSNKNTDIFLKTVRVNFDNSPRYKKNAVTYNGANPETYKRYLKQIISHTKKTNPLLEKYVFIFAWNEWAESAHLEPDRKYGYAYLKATREAVLEQILSRE